MKAFILSAGKGERLKPLTNNSPKVMLPIHGKPVLEHLILLCKKYGIDEFMVNLYWQRQKIIDYFGKGDKFNVRIDYSNESELLGTAGSLKKMENFLQEPFLVLYGDVMMNVDLLKFIEFHKKKKGIATLVLHKSSHPEDSDLVQLDLNDKIIKFWGRPRNKNISIKLTSAGLLILEPKIFDYIPKNKYSSLEKNIFPFLIKEKVNIFGYETLGYLKDMGTLKRYEEVLKDVEIMGKI